MSEVNPEGGVEVLPILERIKVTYIGRLEDLALGNSEGIPTDLTEENMAEFAEKLPRSLAPVTDTAHLGCIDGRRTLHNEDGSKPEVRHRQVSGSGIALETAIGSEAPLLDTIETGTPPMEINEVLGNHLRDTVGFLQSAHRGGCGGLGGMVEDARSMAKNPAIAAATKAFMEIDAVKEFLGTTYDERLMNRIQASSQTFGDLLEANHWNGADFVDQTAIDEPAGVEVLEVDEADPVFHGHKERALVVVISEDQSVSKDKLAELGLGEVFVMSLKPTRDIAQALAGTHGVEGYQQAVMANVAKHLAVADRLPSHKTPIFLVAA